jgi:hypothetical protein
MKFSNISSEDNAKNALIELKHIQLELENRRSQHFRHFVDQYYCYKNNYVNSNGVANWNLIFFRCTVSLEACKLAKNNLVIKDHAVPLKVIREYLIKLYSNGGVTIEGIAEVLDKYVSFATISRDEDRALGRMKLTSKMPECFDTPGHELFGDLHARYKCAGIVLCNDERCVQTKRHGGNE